MHLAVSIHPLVLTALLLGLGGGVGVRVRGRVRA